MNDDAIHLNLPATHKYLNVLAPVLAEVLSRVDPPVDLQTIYGIQLAVQEACTNIVNHAYAESDNGRIDITVQFDDHRRCLTITLTDTGEPFDMSQVKMPNLNQPQVHGYGLMLIYQLMDEVLYNAHDEGNRWRLVKRL